MADQSLKEQQLVKQQEAGTQFAQLAIRSLILVSGGSVIAILTFLGNLWTKDDALARMTAQHLQRSLVLLVVALVASVVTAVLGYVSALAQVYRLTKPRSFLGRNAFLLRLVAITCGLLATGIFAAGAIKASLDLGG
jgi:uncharacterized BrkB/YihY/UPF0761 family membrane protein